MVLLNDEDVARIAEKVFGGDPVRVLGYVIGDKSQEVIGYLGNHLTLTLTVSANGARREKVLFIKTYSVEETHEDFIGETGIFQKEVDLYRVLVEDVAAHVGEPQWCPKYYYSKRIVLVLEDLSEKGFKMAADSISLNKAHLKVALQTLASMHASSFLLEKKKSAPLNTVYPQIFKEIIYDENNLEAPSRKWISWQIQDLLVGIDYLKKYTPQQKETIKERFPDEIKRIYPLSKRSKKYKNVLTHGDMWRNNLLFRYQENNNPIECKFVDFQFSRYAPPAHDVMHLLHYATKRSFRDEEEPELLKSYYENLGKNFSSNGRNVQEELTWTDFVESCKEYKELAVIQSLLSLHYLLGPVTLKIETETYKKYEDFLAAHRQDYMKKFFAMDSYSDKITDMIEELIDCYIINK